MSFVIEDVKKYRPVANGMYLFDANIWLAILDPTFSKPYMSAYEDLFDDIITQKSAKATKVVIPSLLLSEVLNRYMNDIFYKEFCLRNPISAGMSKHEHYKHVYRAHVDYSRDLSMACASMRSYSRSNGMTFLSDNLDKFTFKQLTKNIPTFLDINDHLYAEIAKAQGIIVVTNDGDFKVEGITVVTGNPALLKLKT